MNASSFINGSRTLIFLDLETTGLDAHKDSIIEVGCLKVERNQVVSKFDILVNPGVPIPLSLQRLTGISQEEVNKQGRAWTEVRPLVTSFISQFPVVGHNIYFDRDFLRSHGLELSNTFYDTAELACLLFPCLGHYSLVSLLKHFSCQVGRSHRALTDCESAYQLWCRLLDTVKPDDALRIERINDFLAGTDWKIREILIDLVKYLKEEKASQEDKQAVSATEKPGPTRWPEFSSLFAQGGLLEKNWPGYEVRPEQQAMAQSVWQAFGEKKYLFIEAGTGVGKSLAYLFPCLYHIHQAQKKIVISTNTKNLQDQLWHKEIPFLQQCFPGNFTACLVKGRENYVCLRQWPALTGQQLPLFPEERKALAYFSSWIDQTNSGLLEEISGWCLNKIPGLRELVEEVRSEEGNCLHRHCPWFKRCHYQRMKKKAVQADLILTNHALTLKKPAWFPPFSCLVLDEAHNVEDVATEVYSQEISLREVEMVLAWLKEKNPYNRMRLVWSTLSKEGFLSRKEAGLLRETLRERLEFLERQVIPDLTGAVISLMKDCRTVLISEAKLTFEWSSLKNKAKDFLLVWKQLKQLLKGLFPRISSASVKNASLLEASQTVSSILERLEKIRESLEFILAGDDPEYVGWLEVEKGKPEGTIWRLKAAPLEPGKWLAESYQNLESIVFTSATLTVAGDFRYFLDRLGANRLPAERVMVKVLGSPFDYQRSALLAVPNDFPAFSHQEPEEFLNSLAQGILSAAEATRGKILVLFNSVERMNKVYAWLKPTLEKENILLLCQNIDGNRRALAEQLSQASEATVLFGTKSFREGVDISGLTGVVLEKLPFPSPDDPVIAGRRKYLFSQGRNAWKEYLLPLSTIAFRQAFGRLIRRKSDYGFFMVFDARLLSSFRVMKESLPNCQELVGPLAEFPEALTKRLVALKEKKR
ncbi:MAG: exonuclease domain-containing protein [Candidatus Omnitrophica bacterium]|nr:exonuclease domain-containing protein [Candidatus Omnitrophota bacterium]